MKWLYFPFFDHHIANSAHTAEELRVNEALRTAAEFRWDAVAPRFLDLYAELCASAADGADALSSADFSSTPVEGLELAWFQGVSQSAERVFSFASNLFSRANGA